MKMKTSVTISEELLQKIDRVSNNRSSFFEEAAYYLLQVKAKRQRDRQDLKILNRNFRKLNKEAGEVLDFQSPI